MQRIAQYVQLRRDSKTHMIEKLNHLQMEANEQKDKDAIRDLIAQMESN